MLASASSCAAEKDTRKILFLFDSKSLCCILKRIEAGSPAIGEAIALGAAVDYLSQFGMLRIHEYEKTRSCVPQNSWCHHYYFVDLI